MGLDSPFVLQAKNMWQDKTKNDSLESANFQNWVKWTTDLNKRKEFRVPRCLVPSDFRKIVRRQIHNFSDAF